MMILTMMRSFWRAILTLLRDNSGDMPVPDVSKMFENFPDILTIKNLQDALSIGRSTAYRLISSGAIKHWKIGKTIKIPKPYLLDYIAGSCYTDDTATNPPL